MKLTWKLPSEVEVKESHPLTEESEKTIRDSRKELSHILTGKSDKKVLIIGPCSADYIEPLSKYAEKISEFRKKYWDKIEIIMRFYTWKPRTVWWWKWLSNSTPGGEANISKWIMESRELAVYLIEKYKIPLADEMLHPQFANLFNDIYTYLAIWARSTENQYHREVASWLEPIAIWFKNPTSWDIQTMVNSILAWQKASSFTIWDSIYDSSWNNLSHWILRWWRINDINISNFDIESLRKTHLTLIEKWVINPWFIVDTNHENSNKRYKEQINIMIAVLESISKLKNEWINISDTFKWFMVESYLFDGRQDWPKDNNPNSITKWLSLTDPCIWIDETERFIEEMYWRL